ncbi:Uncharacterized conserved protein, heparinase superfamily [Poseidonocella pacifica]|uniref:Uncharacterized conserved protein, heparinase superfamily n=1 Tax=Poseidonocella pacifica TaxID=871651 RepID=A0A1I0XJX1_9RHOB|nr:heparinase II/III family protein [Poseidonocella pacifica]SFB01409.1 Uncharacterized conserved protein, heparinase superfamily [Poseidonocella pacifica]
MSQPRVPRGVGAMNRLQARLCGLTRPMTVLREMPLPEGAGDPDRGQELVEGHVHLAGVTGNGADLWEIPAPNANFEAARQGFGWLDDLSAAGTPRARTLAQTWTLGWITRFGRGGGPGWTPELAAFRLGQMLSHAEILLSGAAPEEVSRALGRHLLFLRRRWRAAPRGLPQLRAINALLKAKAFVEGAEVSARPLIRAAISDISAILTPEGGVASRAPDDLFAAFRALSDLRAAIAALGLAPSEDLDRVLTRSGAILRAVRHADGTLARFHGGGAGDPAAIDRALAQARLRGGPAQGLAMGYARRTAGRSTLIVDAAPPPTGPAAGSAHASTLAFELTSGRRPIIVSCGTSVDVDADWRRAGRASLSHSGLVLDGRSSARLQPETDMLTDGPRDVPAKLSLHGGSLRFEGGHDAYVAATGLTHARILDLSPDGRGLSGEDLVVTLDAAAGAQFRRALANTGGGGIPVQIRFHLHPDVEASPHPDGGVILVLPSGERWHFDHDGHAELTFAPSVYLEAGQREPRPTDQIILTGRATGEATRVRWQLTRTPDDHSVTRDLIAAALPLVPA